MAAQVSAFLFFFQTVFHIYKIIFFTRFSPSGYSSTDAGGRTRIGIDRQSGTPRFFVQNAPASATVWNTVYEVPVGVTSPITMTNGILGLNTTFQSQLNGTGFVKASGTTVSYDNTSYLPLAGGTLTGALSGTSATFSSSVTATGFFNSSDIRKKIILSKDGDVIHFKWKKEFATDTLTHIGYAAQWMLPKYPEQVTKGNDGYYSVNYTEIHTEKIRELEKEMAELKQEIIELKAERLKLNAKNKQL